MGSLRLYVYFAGFLALLAAGRAVYNSVDAGGYDRCQSEQAVALAQAKEQNHAEYLAAIAWGNQISANLAQAQQRIQTLKDENENFAARIRGTCPVSLRYLHDAAASGEGLSDPARASLGSAATVDASWIGQTVSSNYARARECQAKLNALIDWYEKWPTQ